MTTALRDRIDNLKQAYSCIELVQRHSNVQLRKHGVQELCGPCPRCGGDDRFYVAPAYAACRQCHPKRMDAVGLLAWLHNVSQSEAANMLDGGATWQPVKIAPSNLIKPDKTGHSEDFSDYAKAVVLRAQELLRTPAGQPACDYLLSRGLTQETWRRFEVGYRPNRRLTSDRSTTWPALLWPVYDYDTDDVVAVRYRFLGETPTGDRYVSLKGSSMRERLFGVQALPEYVLLPPDANGKNAERLRCLVFVEGELNAMSIWQVANHTGVDVLSTGSESVRRLPAWAVELASRYGAVLAWFDKPDVAANIAQQLPYAQPVQSPVIDGKAQDANDVLQRGLLGGLVQERRLQALRDVSLREGVYWDIWDAAGREGGVDKSTAFVAQKLAQELGMNAEPFDRMLEGS